MRKIPQYKILVALWSNILPVSAKEVVSDVSRVLSVEVVSVVSLVLDAAVSHVGFKEIQAINSLYLYNLPAYKHLQHYILSHQTHSLSVAHTYLYKYHWLKTLLHANIFDFFAWTYSTWERKYMYIAFLTTFVSLNILFILWQFLKAFPPLTE